ncbi:DUF711 family protein [Actinophytocola sp.]|uniref:DUF711 family protein n=1 Tax=Actinophytocola sp. TaxID=1872138 RepID=UPI002ED5E104
MSKIVRTICRFVAEPDGRAVDSLAELSGRLRGLGYEIQTTRVCGGRGDIAELARTVDGTDVLASVGRLPFDSALAQLPAFFAAGNVSFNVDLAGQEIEPEHVDLVRRIIEERPGHTFNFCYTFNNRPSSPFFPSATYAEDGFAVGLQAVDLADGLTTLDDWLSAMAACWREIADEFRDEPGFLGIDGSPAPFGAGKGSLVEFVRRLGMTFPESATSTIYLTITDFLREHNPKIVGLNGLMLPCLEDAALAAEYESGEFTVERNLFLSLHSGLGIDTYPVGVDERPERMLQVLRLVRALSNKHRKPLSIRFVSDGRARIGERTDFRSPYLVDCVVRPL